MIKQQLIPYRKGDKWGYCDINKKIIIPVKYDFAKLFQNNFAVVGLKGKAAVIDCSGKKIIPFIYDEIEIFSDGFIKVRSIDKYGIFNNYGIEITQIIYDEIKTFEHNCFWNGLTAVNYKGKWGIIDNSGHKIIDHIYDDIEIDEEVPELIKVNIGAKLQFDPKAKGNLLSGGKWGIINKIGEVVAPFKYDFIGYFCNGFVPFKINDKMGIIDTKGIEVLRAKYFFAWSYPDGIRIGLNDNFGYIDKEWKEIISDKYSIIDYLSEDYDVALLDDKGFSVIKKSGEIVIPFEYDVIDSFDEGMLRVERNNKKGYLDLTNKEIIPIKYDDIGPFKDGLAPVNLNDSYGYVNRSGEIIIPLIYDYTWHFKNGLARVNIGGKFIKIENSDYNCHFEGGKWGLINKNGEQILPIKYDMIFQSDDDLIIVNIGGAYKHNSDFYTPDLINPESSMYDEEFKKHQYKESFDTREVKKSFNRTEWCAFKGGKWGFINASGHEVISAKYDRVSPFENSLSFVQLNNKYGYIDKIGREYFEK
jgi:hypothetical protein